MYKGITAIVLGAWILGCGPKFDENSGADLRIAGAGALGLSIPDTDRVSHDDGDNTDWKYFDYDEVRGRVQIDIFWDDPQVESRVTLRDQFGSGIYEWRHRRGLQHESFPDIRVREGRYFLEIICTDGVSVYTVEVVDHAELEGAGGEGLRPE